MASKLFKFFAKFIARWRRTPEDTDSRRDIYRPYAGSFDNKWGTGTVVPRATTDGGSSGYDPEKPGKVIIDPRMPGCVEVDLSKLTNRKIRRAIEKAGGVVGLGDSTADATFAAYAALGKPVTTGKPAKPVTPANKLPAIKLEASQDARTAQALAELNARGLKLDDFLPAMAPVSCDAETVAAWWRDALQPPQQPQ